MAVTRSYQWIPELLTRITHEDVPEYVDHGEREDTPNADMGCNEHSQISLTVRDEYPEILEKDGELDEKDSRNVDDYSSIEPLAARSACYEMFLAMNNSLT